MLERYWSAAVPFKSFLDTAVRNAELWRSLASEATLHDHEAARAEALPAARKILVLAEDWCGDAARSVPTIAALAAQSSVSELRLLNTGEHPEALADRLTKGARAIPIVVVFDSDGKELGSWGPRPAPLQALLREKLRTEGSPDKESRKAFYAPVLDWYAEDQGRTVAQELLMLLERGG